MHHVLVFSYLFLEEQIMKLVSSLQEMIFRDVGNAVGLVLVRCRMPQFVLFRLVKE